MRTEIYYVCVCGGGGGVVYVFSVPVGFKPNYVIVLQQQDQRTIGPENAHLKPDLGVLSHNEMTLTLNTHTPLLTS